MNRKYKLQSAMEYLMTYGWAILIIAVVLGALFQLGVFNATNFAPRAPPGSCRVFRPSGPGTVSNINLVGVCSGQLPQYAVQFNGQSSYIQITSFSVPNTLTASGWIYYSADSGNSEYITQGPITLYIGSGSHGFNTAFSWSDSSTTYYSSGIGISLNSWHFVTVTYDGNNIRSWVDGIAGSTVPATKSLPSTPGFYIGATFSPKWWNGMLANVQIYNTSLSANDIQALYIEGIGGAPQNLRSLVGWWPLNGNANDYSGNNNNGVPTNLVYTNQWLNGYVPP